MTPLADPAAFGQFLAALRASDWVVYAKPQFAGPTQVLEYLGRYTPSVDWLRTGAWPSPTTGSSA